jgi:RNA ligase
MAEFQDFPKMARWSREIIVTEKIDGTNAQVFIDEDGEFAVGSRTRWITPADDNYGFAAWAHANKDELMKLGPGRHFGEWWGRGIQCNYAKPDRTFSLFNVTRWADPEVRPACCSVVPTLYRGMMFPGVAEKFIRELERDGSVAAPGFMQPEGIVIYHVAAGIGFKKTILKDEVPKSKVIA